VTITMPAPSRAPVASREQDRLAMRVVENYHRDSMTETWLDATPGASVVLLRDHKRGWGAAMWRADHFWLILDGTAVAYLHTMSHYERETHQQVLCDIEVRSQYRGQGHTRRIIDAAAQVLGDTLWTTGSFTPLGSQALDWMPVLPGYDAGIKFPDMGFVEDWDNLIPNNAL
jgi:GNAT superfamily N-acetyltransferase